MFEIFRLRIRLTFVRCNEHSKGRKSNLNAARMRVFRKPGISWKSAWMGALIIFLASDSALRAEDPTRFLSVTNWYATFTRTLHSSGSGSGAGCAIDWSFAHSGSVSTELWGHPLV